MSHKAEPPAVRAGGTADERSTKSDSDTYVADLRRRREASWRLPPLYCGCRDPWHYDEPPLTDHQLDAWVDTIGHLAGLNLPPIVPASVHRALRRRWAA